MVAYSYLLPPPLDAHDHRLASGTGNAMQLFRVGDRNPRRWALAGVSCHLHRWEAGARSCSWESNLGRWVLNFIQARPCSPRLSIGKDRLHLYLKTPCHTHSNACPHMCSAVSNSAKEEQYWITHSMLVVYVFPLSFSDTLLEEGLPSSSFFFFAKLSQITVASKW